MTWPFSVLKISPTSDKVAIKKAYARVLKDNRPDENPSGFQQVNEAYQAALQGDYCSSINENTLFSDVESSDIPKDTEQHQDAGEQTSFDNINEEQSNEHNDPHTIYKYKYPEHTQNSDDQTNFNELQKTQHIDFNDFYTELKQQVILSSPNVFENWLQAIPELWFLEYKESISNKLFLKLRGDEFACSKQHLDIILNFFNLDGFNFSVLHDREHHFHMLWVFDTSQQVYIKKIDHLVIEMQLLKQLKKPFSWLQILCVLFLPWRASRWRKQLNTMLTTFGATTLHTYFNPTQVNYWIGKLHNPRTHRNELQSLIGGVILLYWGVWVICLLLIGTFIATNLNPRTSLDFLAAYMSGTLSIISLICYKKSFKYSYIDISNTVIRKLLMVSVPFSILISISSYLIYFFSNTLLNELPETTILCMIFAVTTSSIRFDNARITFKKTYSHMFKKIKFRVSILLICFFIVTCSVALFKTSYWGYALIASSFWYFGIRIEYPSKTNTQH